MFGWGWFGEDQKEQMIRNHLHARGIHDERILNLFREVDRALFVPESQVCHAYEDRPLPIGEGQTISQPYITALMVQELEIIPRNRILEIGTGSGFQTALLAKMGKEVVSVELLPILAEQARERLKRMGYTNIRILTGDGSLGPVGEEPFDRVVVSAAAPRLPTPLLECVSTPGILICPVGDRYEQRLLKIIKNESGTEKQDLGGVVFVPLIGQAGFDS